MFWACVEGGITASMTMFEKLNFIKPLVIGGAAAAAIAVIHLALRSRHRAIVREHCDMPGLEEDEKKFPLKLGLRY